MWKVYLLLLQSHLLAICSCSRNLVHIKLCGEELVASITTLNSVVDLPAHWLSLTGGSQQSACLVSLLSSSLSGSILAKFSLRSVHGMPGPLSACVPMSRCGFGRRAVLPELSIKPCSALSAERGPGVAGTQQHLVHPW